MSITHIQLFSVPVTNHDRARTFYVDRLGFDLISDRPMGPDGRWVQVAPEGAQTSIALVSGFETMPPGSVKGIVLETDDLVADVAALRDRGVEIEGEVEEARWGRWVTFDDPDGNGIILQATAPVGPGA